MVARHIRKRPHERAINDRPYGFVRRRFVTSNPPINQNLNGKLMFIGVFAVTLQGLSKNGRGSREAGGEAAPFYVAKWHVAVHWYKFRNLIRRLRRHLLPFLEKALNARHFVSANSPINQNLKFFSCPFRFRQKGTRSDESREKGKKRMEKAKEITRNPLDIQYLEML